MSLIAAASPSPVPLFSGLQSGGTVDDHMQFVYTWIFWISIAIGIFVSGLILYAAFRFRRRSDDEDPEQVHGSSKLEWTWTVVPFAILICLFIMSALNMEYIRTAPTAQSSGKRPLEVTVIGQQFSWTYDYYGEHKRDHSDVRAATLYVPANTPVELHIVSTDVSVLDSNGNSVPSGCAITPGTDTEAQLDLQQRIDKARQQGVAPELQLATAIAGQGCGVNHSFFIPSLAGQMNAIPGQINYLWFDARPGDYYGQCTELCGAGHANMLIEVKALSPQDWSAWLQQETSK